MISQTAEYALIAVVHLASDGEGAPRSVDEISGGVPVPRNYLSKLLHALGRAGIVQSVRGRKGGFQLARDPEQLSLAEVVSVFDDLSARSGCLLGRAQCSDEHPCAAHERWKEVTGNLRSFLDSTTIAELAAIPEPADAADAGGRQLSGRTP